MKQEIIFLLLTLFSFSAIGQEKIWTNRLEFQVSSSFYEVDNNLRGVLWTFNGPKYQISMNYAFGWNTSIQISKNIFLESGLSFVRRKDENADFYNSCFNVSEDVGCFGLNPVVTDKRHHLLTIPIRVRLQKQFSTKFMGFWSGSLNNYLQLFTVYKDSTSFKTKEKYKNYYGYSINTAVGIRHPLTTRCNIELEVNARLYEKYRQEEILGGDLNKFNVFSFNNVNMMLSLNYYL